MRKLLLSALLVASSAAVFAQNLDDVQESISKGKYDEAREKIDKILANPKQQKNANAWYNKAIVYTNLAVDTTKKDKDYVGEAFAALQQYYALDPKNVMGNLEQNIRLLQLYQISNYNAFRDFNAKDFQSSFNNFRNALALEEFMKQKGFTYTDFTPPAFDTTLIRNIAAAASQAKMEDSAMAYYQKIADARITGEDYMSIYQLLIDYYGRKNDTANRNKYMALAKELYPNTEVWSEVELAPLREDKPKLFAKYAELTSANPNSFYLNYNYAVELYNYLYTSGQKPADAATYLPLVEGAIQNAIKADTTQNANLLMVRYHISEINLLEDSLNAIKGTKPADLQRKKTLTAKINSHYEKLVPYGEKIFTAYISRQDLKASDKANLRFVGNTLIDYYDRKGQPQKANQLEAQMKGKI